MAGKRASKTRWGWIAFGTGLVICVAAGGVIGVMLGKGHSRSDAGEVQRVAALALDTSRLNDDALDLSRAIEVAISREELQSEAGALRGRLARLEARAERIRLRAESQRGAAQGAAPAREEAGFARERARRGLAEVNAALAVFRRSVAARLKTVLDTAPTSEAPSGEASGPPADQALADVMLILERQSQTMGNLSSDLSSIQQGAETSTGMYASRGEQPADMVSGSFESALVRPGFTLQIGYELQGLSAEADAAGAEPGKAQVTGSASGRLTVTNTTRGRSASFELPAFRMVLYWKESELPSAVSEAEVSTDLSGEPAGASEEPSPEADAPCRYGFNGDRYCALVGFAFDEAESGPDATTASTPQRKELEPGEAIGLDVLGADGSLIVGEREADLVAEFIGSRRPDVVRLLSASPGGDLRPACVVHSAPAGADGYEEVDASTLGLLTGDGRIIFETTQPDRAMPMDAAGDPELPECYTLLYG